MQQLNKLSHCVFNLQYHLVLVTKYRRRCISNPMLVRLKEILSSTAQKWGCRLIEFNGEQDHVHLLLELNTKVCPSIFINNLKTVSSRLIRKEFAKPLKKCYRKPVFWSRSYCLLSCGGAPLSVLKRYIQKQRGID